MTQMCHGSPEGDAFVWHWVPSSENAAQVYGTQATVRFVIDQGTCDAQMSERGNHSRSATAIAS